MLSIVIRQHFLIISDTYCVSNFKVYYSSLSSPATYFHVLKYSTYSLTNAFIINVFKQQNTTTRIYLTIVISDIYS